jgi:hypothetical protein
VPTADVLSLFLHEGPGGIWSTREVISAIVTNDYVVYSIPVVRTRSALNFLPNGNHGARGGTVKPTARSHASRVLSRREILVQSATAAVGFSIVPRHVLGGSGYVPPSDKVNIAFIGVGAQGLRVMLHFLREPDVQGVAVCDVNKGSAGYPQWSDHEFCNSVRKLIGVDSGCEWLSPNQPIQITHTIQITSGVAGRDSRKRSSTATTVRRSVPAKDAQPKRLPRTAGEAEDVDAVVVNDHLHAAISAAAMKSGNMSSPEAVNASHESRRIAEIARETGVATQIAVAIKPQKLLGCSARIWDGAIGPVHEVINWSAGRGRRQSGPKEQARPRRSRLGFWLEPAPERLQSAFTLPVAGMGRLRLRLARRHGLLQLRHDLPSDET